MLTQSDLNDGPIVIASCNELVMYGEQTGTKGLYEITYSANGIDMARPIYVEGIVEVRRKVKRFNALFNQTKE